MINRTGTARGLAWIATAAMALTPELGIAADPNPARAHAPPAPKVSALDVELAPGGVLRGTACNATGQPLANTRVVLQRDSRPISEASTDVTGRFQFVEVRGGTYQIAVGEMIIPVRAWAPNTAPPGANQEVLATPHFVTRGQVHPWAGTLTNPWIFAALLTAAIVIPIALHNNRQDRPSSS